MSGTGFLVTDTSSAGPSATDDDTSTAVTEPTTPSPLPTTTFGTTGRIVSYTVPVTGFYDITAIGASGSPGSGSTKGGLGADVSGELKLAAGEVLSIAVGGTGGAPAGTFFPPTPGAGGGGSFVVAPGNVPLVIAGGGGGAEPIEGNGGNGEAIASSGGGGGRGEGGGGGGGGLQEDGSPGLNLRTPSAPGGSSFVNGATAGHIPPTTLT
jgi:hypothetical protein